MALRDLSLGMVVSQHWDFDYVEQLTLFWRPQVPDCQCDLLKMKDFVEELALLGQSQVPGWQIKLHKQVKYIALHKLINSAPVLQCS